MADIREKIQKLLNLAESPNENEARAALLKARELMAQNKLSEDDFNKKEAKLASMDCEDIKWTTDSGDIWMVSLCKLICNNYCCVASWRTARGSRTHMLVITGLEDDVTVCGEVIAYAIGFIRSAIIRVGRRTPGQDIKSVKRSYAEGFITGLEIAFEMQKEQHQEWGLVLVKPKEVQEYEDNLGCKNVKTKQADFDPLAYMKGHNDGLEFNAGKVIGSAS
jgi:hypothetical protein